MPSAAAETTRKPREGKNALPIMTFLLLDVLIAQRSAFRQMHASGQVVPLGPKC
jgi:hypothetical protein